LNYRSEDVSRETFDCFTFTIFLKTG